VRRKPESFNELLKRLRIEAVKSYVSDSCTFALSPVAVGRDL
jgi:hypothetical protein